MPAVDSFTLVSANMDPLSCSPSRPSALWCRSPRWICCTCPVRGPRRPLDTPLVATVHDVTPLLYPRSLPLMLRLRYKGQLQRHARPRQADHHGVAGLAVGAERLRRRESGQGAGDPQRGVGAVPARRHAPRSRRLLAVTTLCRSGSSSGWATSGRRRTCRSSSTPGRACCITSPIRPCWCWPAPSEASTASCGKRWRSAGWRTRSSSRASSATTICPRSIRRPPCSSSRRSTRASGCRRWRPWPAAPPAWSRTRRRCPRSPGRRRCSSTPPRSTAWRTASCACCTDHDLYEALRQDGLRQSALFPWSKAAEETLDVYRSVLEES